MPRSCNVRVFRDRWHLRREQDAGRWPPKFRWLIRCFWVRSKTAPHCSSSRTRSRPPLHGTCRPWQAMALHGIMEVDLPVVSRIQFCNAAATTFSHDCMCFPSKDLVMIAVLRCGLPQSQHGASTPSPDDNDVVFCLVYVSVMLSSPKQRPCR